MFVVSDEGSQQWEKPPKADCYNSKELNIHSQPQAHVLTTTFCLCTSPQIDLLLG